MQHVTRNIYNFLENIFLSEFMPFSDKSWALKIGNLRKVAFLHLISSNLIMTQIFSILISTLFFQNTNHGAYFQYSANDPNFPYSNDNQQPHLQRPPERGRSL